MATLFVCGDVLNYGNHDGKVCEENLAKIIRSADYSVCNFEAPITGFGTPQPKVGPHHSQCEQTINGLKEQGFDLLLLANNHIMDFGKDALEATLERAGKSGLDVIGAGLDRESAYSPLVKEIDGVKIGMINAGEAQFGVLDFEDRPTDAGYAWVNHPVIDKNILKLRKECDFVVVFSHAGLEHYRIPQKEWRMRYRLFCDLGADIVIGSHPHVPQGYEEYNNSIIFYSLGNFYFDSKNFRDKEDNSFSVKLNFIKGKPLDFELVFHYKKTGKINLAPIEKQVDVTNLCRQLSKGYIEAHDQMSLEIYEKLYFKNFFSALNPVASIKRWFRTVIASMISRKKMVGKSLLLLHLFRNEAYYYAARHALELLAKEEFSSHE